jgi:hypothetical protein
MCNTKMTNNYIPCLSHVTRKVTAVQLTSLCQHTFLFAVLSLFLFQFVSQHIVEAAIIEAIQFCSSSNCIGHSCHSGNFLKSNLVIFTAQIIHNINVT